MSFASSDRHDCFDTVKAKLGVYPIFYASTSFVEGLHLKETVGDGLWQADYGQNVTSGIIQYPAPVPAPWKKRVLHQFTQFGVWPGVTGHVDFNFGSLSAIQANPILAKL